MILWKKEVSSANYIDLLPSNQDNFSMFDLSKSVIGTVQKDEVTALKVRKKGNDSFKEENWSHAMKLYNEGIRFAINGSENLGLCYANRAACFLHLKKYDKCLADIELAKNANYPQHLVHKLNDRKATCLKAMKESAEVDEKFTPQLSFNPNEKFPGMADILEVRRNNEFGIHVVAKHDIDVGKTILLEDGFAFGVNSSCETICKTCAKHNMNFIPCPNCVDVMFCSAKCMESNHLHKKVCGALYNNQHNHRYSLDVETILIAVSAFPNAESLIKFVESALATRDFDSPECESISQAKYRSFLKLFALPKYMSTIGEGVFSTYKFLLEIPHIGKFFTSKRERRFLMHLIGQHHGISATNLFGVPNMEVGSDYMDIVGNCSSLFNHSCTPNTLHLIHGNKMIAYIQRPVKRGEQLFINYFKEKESDPYKHAMLNFQCKCSKCVPCWKEADCDRIQSDANFLFLACSGVKNSDFKDHKKRSVLKPKIEDWFTKFGRLPWSPEFEMMEISFFKSCVEELSTWDY